MSTIDPWEIYKYLKKHGWTDLRFLTFTFNLLYEDLLEVLVNMKEQGSVVFDDRRGVNIPLEQRSKWSKFWAKVVGY